MTGISGIVIITDINMPAALGSGNHFFLVGIALVGGELLDVCDTECDHWNIKALTEFKQHATQLCKLPCCQRELTESDILNGDNLDVIIYDVVQYLRAKCLVLAVALAQLLGRTFRRGKIPGAMTVDALETAMGGHFHLRHQGPHRR